MSKNLRVELDGVVRILAKSKEIPLTLSGDITWRDVIAALAQSAPALVGSVITKDRRDLVGTRALNLNGEYSICNLDEIASFSDGDFVMIVEEPC